MTEPNSTVKSEKKKKKERKKERWKYTSIVSSIVLGDNIWRIFNGNINITYRTPLYPRT